MPTGYRIRLVSLVDGSVYVAKDGNGRARPAEAVFPSVYGLDVNFPALHARTGAESATHLTRLQHKLGTRATGSPISQDNAGRACRQLAGWASAHPAGVWRVDRIEEARLSSRPVAAAA